MLFGGQALRTTTKRVVPAELANDNLGSYKGISSKKVNRLAKRQFICYKRMGDKSLCDIIYKRYITSLPIVTVSKSRGRFEGI
jgi:hypothetical protein